jgi:hypothetical protein
MKEAELYPPLKEFFTQQGYDVKGEIQNCDVIAIQEGMPIIVIELKLSLNLTILLQAVDRLSTSDTIYIGVPKGIPILKKQRKRIVKLMRMLGIGLIAIDPRAKIGNVDILCNPSEYKPRQSKQKTAKILKEFNARIGDPNSGGSSMQGGIMTAYRQKAIAIADYLNQNGETKASIIAKALTEPKTRDILYQNVYGWFQRFGKGRYALSKNGETAIQDWLSHDQI